MQGYGSIIARLINEHITKTQRPYKQGVKENMDEFTPTVLYHSKLIKLDQIVLNEVESQSRNQSIDKDNLKGIEQSIAQVGLKNPIAVEVVHIDPHDESNSKFKLRDGCHRFKAYQNLQATHKNTTNFDRITCVVYEKNVRQCAAFDWLQWQHQQNEHLEKRCRHNSYEDSIVTAYKLLMAGYLGKDIAKLVEKGQWSSPLVDDALGRWFKNNCKGLSESARDQLITDVHLRGSHLRNCKVKHYSRSDLQKILLSKYGIKPGRGGATSPTTNTTVWIASEQDSWTKVLSPVYRVFKDGGKAGNNTIVFHCRKGTVNHINAQRKKIKERVKTVNDWFSNNIPAFKHVKVIDDVKILGQKLAKEYGEKDGEFC